MPERYEALVILRGTLSEEETGPTLRAVQSVIEKNGGDDIICHDLGKNRLAYPIAHVRYGYPRACYFTASPEAVSIIQKKMLSADHVLRAIVRRFNAKKQAERKTPIAEGILRREWRDAGETARSERTIAEAVQTANVMAEPARDPEPTEPRTTEAIEIKDIEKKLDEILESDLTKM